MHGEAVNAPARRRVSAAAALVLADERDPLADDLPVAICYEKHRAVSPLKVGQLSFRQSHVALEAFLFQRHRAGAVGRAGDADFDFPSSAECCVLSAGCGMLSA